jgi:DNA-binding NtrC family response regulator
MDKSNILIVDDMSNVLSSLERQFLDEPYHIFFADNGEKALEILDEIACKVVISDIKMPRMDGFELLAKVKELYPDIVRVVLSGHFDVKLILDMVNMGGIDRYLMKPWDFENMRAIINQCIELYDLRKEVYALRKKVKK